VISVNCKGGQEKASFVLFTVRKCDCRLFSMNREEQRGTTAGVGSPITHSEKGPPTPAPARPVAGDPQPLRGGPDPCVCGRGSPGLPSDREGLAQGCESHCGMQAMSILGQYKTYYGMFRVSTKDWESESSGCFGKE